MFALFDQAQVGHYRQQSVAGNDWQHVLRPVDYATAYEEISQWPGYAPTPLLHLKSLARELNLGSVLYKDESGRFGLGSFKVLGAAYAASRVLQRELACRLGRSVTLKAIRTGVLASEASRITLVSATDGNHGRSLAWGAKRCGAPCRIYIHREVSEGRAAALRSHDAQVIRVDGNYDDSVRIARQDAEANGWFVVSDTSWEGYSEPPRDVMAGYGVMVRELNETLDQAPTHVLLQCGVGGLPAAVSAAMKYRWGSQMPRVMVVEPRSAACLYQSAQLGRVQAVNVTQESMMAGLSCGSPSQLAWTVLQQLATDFITIPDTLVAPTMRLLARPLGTDPAIEAGESAVAGLAAVIALAGTTPLRSACHLTADSRILVFGTEGATDRAIYEQLLGVPS
ncbi:MAG TPA: diaminopropionate ammonia-lyase [Gammaproteobacteria bacterium]|nr:diaminopropionate ammonia-lyase [Gammaproteobacteria bacterium]